MAILNKKSMLFLLATILLICSSYADDHLSSAGREERALMNFGDFKSHFGRINMFNAISRLNKYTKNAKKYKGYEDLLKESLATICTGYHKCESSDRCDVLKCAYKYVRNEELDCKTECGGN